MLLVIVVTYLLANLVIGAVLSSRVKRASDYLLAGRNLGLFLTTASLVAVQLGAGVVLGGAETGASLGVWPGLWYGIGCGGGLILAGVLAAKRMRSHGGVVPIDFFAWRYGERRWIRTWAWVSNIPSLLGILAAQLMAAGFVMTTFGFTRTQGILIIGAVILLSNVMSGMWGVVATDVLQVSIILVGIPIASVAAVSHMGSANLADVVGTPFIPPGQWTRAVFLITPFLFSISVSYDAFIRYQSARSADVAKWACILSGIPVMAISFCASLVGAAGKRAFPAVAAGDVLPHVITTTLAPVVAGIVLSALLAAAMSAGHSLLMALAGCFSRDFYNKVLNPTKELDELPHGTLYARLAVVGSLVFAVLAALHARSILDTIIIFNYPYMGSMLVPLLGGVLWSGATTRGAYAAMAVGGTIGVAAFLAGIPGPLHGLFNIDLALLIAFGASAVALVAVSLMDKAAPQAGTVRQT